MVEYTEFKIEDTDKLYPRFAIVNDCDRPYSRLVAEFIPERGGYCYLAQGNANDKRLKVHDGMLPYFPTAIEDFGIEVDDSFPNHYVFKVVRDSTATYRDGLLRQWQGEDTFILPRILKS